MMVSVQMLCKYKVDVKKSPSKDGTHHVNQQLLAGFTNAPEGHVDILLAWQAIHAIIQGVRHCFGHLKHSTMLCQWTAITHSNNVLHNTKSQSASIWGKTSPMQIRLTGVHSNPSH